MAGKHIGPWVATGGLAAQAQGSYEFNPNVSKAYALGRSAPGGSTNPFQSPTPQANIDCFLAWASGNANRADTGAEYETFIPQGPA